MEIWKEIKDYPNYEVSSLGNIRGPRGRRKQVPHRDGYLTILLSKNGRVKSFLVHRLVAAEFIQNPSKKPCVNHIDGNKSNNNASNLEWVTHSENGIHAIKTGLQKTCGEDGTKSKLKEFQVKDIIKDLAGGKETLKAIAKKYHVTPGTVGHIKHGRTWKHVSARHNE